jgi:hypothetical protein
VAIIGAGTDNNFVQGNLIGTDGNMATPNEVGVWIERGASGNLIGGSDVGAGNVISGNLGDGIAIGDGSDTEVPCMGNRIAGNTIGLERFGNSPLPNGGSGIKIWGNVTGTVIGGPTLAERNSISGNTEYGIDLFKGHGTIVQNNYIGIAASGLAVAGNGYDGISIVYSNDCVIGGDAPALNKAKDATQTRGNVIAHNGFNGVSVQIGTRNAIRGNAIYSNGKLGIDIARDQNGVNDGPNANDNLDADTGANDQQNWPEITDARVIKLGSKFVTTVSGVLHSLPNPGTASEKNSFLLDFYANYNTDPSGYGEGDTWIDAAEVVTGANGSIVFQIDLPGDFRGRSLTASATRKVGKAVQSTSEFSPPKLIAPPTP